MTHHEWKLMSAKEKSEYLSSHTAELNTQTVMDGSKRRDDPELFKTVYSICRGGVETGRAYTLLEAAQQDAEPVKWQ